MQSQPHNPQLLLLLLPLLAALLSSCSWVLPWRAAAPALLRVSLPHQQAQALVLRLHQLHLAALVHLHWHQRQHHCWCCCCCCWRACACRHPAAQHHAGDPAAVGQTDWQGLPCRGLALAPALRPSRSPRQLSAAPLPCHGPSCGCMVTACKQCNVLRLGSDCTMRGWKAMCIDEHHLTRASSLPYIKHPSLTTLLPLLHAHTPTATQAAHNQHHQGHRLHHRTHQLAASQPT